MADGKQINEGGVLNGELMIRSCKGGGSLTNTFFIYNFSFFQHAGTLEDEALTKIMDVFTHELNS